MKTIENKLKYSVVVIFSGAAVSPSDKACGNYISESGVVVNGIDVADGGLVWHWVMVDPIERATPLSYRSEADVLAYLVDEELRGDDGKYDPKNVEVVVVKRKVTETIEIDL